MPRNKLGQFVKGSSIFTKAEDKILRQNFVRGDLKELSKQLNKTETQIRCRAKYLGLNRKVRPIDRFYRYVNQNSGIFGENGEYPTECWIWTGAIDAKTGYGRFGVNYKTVLPHRWFYEFRNGSILDALTIDHLCRNRKCVNPKHLEAVSLIENLHRGEGPSALNRHKTVCSVGHTYDRVYNNKRRCSMCDRWKQVHKNLLKYVKNGYVNMQEHGELQIFKYAQKTVMEQKWNPLTKKARGIIFTKKGRLVAKGFDKFFNLSERPETYIRNLPNCEYEIRAKIDGSCGVGFYWNNKWQLATPGSFQSDQAIYGTRMLQKLNLRVLPKNITPIFEIVYPKDPSPKVIKPEEAYLSLLAIFETGGDEWYPDAIDYMAKILGCHRPKKYPNFSLRGDIPFEKELREGFVVRFDNGLRVKIKDPRYVRIHRLLAYMNPKHVIELIQAGEYRAINEQFPKEFQKEFDDIRAFVQTIYDQFEIELDKHYVSMLECIGTDATRKEYALWIQANVRASLRGFMFMKLDGRDPKHKMWTLVARELKNYE